MGTIGLKIPKLRHGSYFPAWLLEPRRRAEKALTAVVAEAYVLGVSTRKVEDLVETLGIERMSKSQVSQLAQELDGVVKSFRERPLSGPYRYVWLDALVLKSREAGRIVNVACLIAVGVNSDGRREVLGLEVVTAEDGAGWLAFLRSLRARGPKGVELVISDAHPGLKDAIASVLRGAAWQRCRTHFIRNLLTKVPKAAHGIVATFVRTIFAQPDAESVRAQYARTVEQLQPRFREAAKMLADAEEILAFTAFPKEHWRQIWSNNPRERLNREIRRRTDVVGIFPNRDSIVRLVGAVLCELNDDWAVVRRYMTIEQREEVDRHEGAGEEERSVINQPDDALVHHLDGGDPLITAERRPSPYPSDVPARADRRRLVRTISGTIPWTARSVGHLTDAHPAALLELCRFKMSAARQLEMNLPTWGGKRKRAGRKPKGARAGVRHASRPRLSKHHPVHVTWRMLPHVWNLRSRRSFRVLSDAFAKGCDRRGFRLVHFSVQGNHLHLVVEAPDEVRLARGLQGLAVRIARRLNRMMGRTGKVFADRYHSHVLRTPAEVARAAAYVVGNFFVHALRRGERIDPRVIDQYSSATVLETGPPVVAQPRTWLLCVGGSGRARFSAARTATPPNREHQSSTIVRCRPES